MLSVNILDLQFMLWAKNPFLWAWAAGWRVWKPIWWKWVLWNKVTETEMMGHETMCERIGNMTSNLLELQEIQKSGVRVLSSQNISGVICLKNETQPQVGVKTFLNRNPLSKSAMVLYFREAFLLTETTLLKNQWFNQEKKIKEVSE